MKRLLPVCLFLAAAASLRAQSADDVVARLQRAESEIQRLQFDYLQVTRIPLTGESVKSRGAALFERPNRFRLDQKTPQPQTVVCDGKDLWFYLPARGQVLRDSVDNWARSAGFPQGLSPFRLETAELRSKYDIALETPDAKTPVLRLTPRGDRAFPYDLRVWVDLATGLPVKTELSSKSVTATTTVKNFKINVLLSPDAFRFSPPARTDVIDAPLK